MIKENQSHREIAKKIHHIHSTVAENFQKTKSGIYGTEFIDFARIEASKIESGESISDIAKK